MNTSKKILILSILTAAAAASSCAEVAPPRSCTLKFDCEAHEMCSEGICVIDPCFDGVRSEGESDIDCGHVCSARCGESLHCEINADCESGTCSEGTCVDTEKGCRQAVPGDLMITEILNNVSTGKTFEQFTPDSTQTEFFEIYNSSDKKVSLSSISIECARTDDGSYKKVSFPMSGCIEPKNAAVISNAAITGMPEGVINIQTLPEAGVLTNTATYECSLVHQDYDEHGGELFTPIHTVIIDAQAKAGTSEVLTPVEYSTSANLLVIHSDVSEYGYKHSPGYCTNGALYINNCDTLCNNGVMDDGETDIDCGGSCAQCESGKTCSVITDCITGLCSNNVCEATTAQTADPSDLIVNEILDSGSASPAFALNDDAAACEFVEIANPTDKDVNLYGLTLSLKGKNKDGVDQTPVEIPLSGVLKSKNLAVVHNCTTLPLPNDAIAIQTSKTKILTGTWTYDVDLVSSSKTSSQLSGLAIGGVVNSSYNRDPDMTANASMVKTTSMTDYAAFATPGYCANGGLYSEGCKTQCENGRRDGDEADVDCGGSCTACGNDKLCTKNSDCLSNQCSGGRCSGEIPVTPVPTDLVINEVMAAPSTSTFSLNGDAGACEFIEIVNVSNHKLLLDGSKLLGTQTSSSTTSKEVALNGILQPKAAAILNNCEALALPSDAISITIPNKFLTDGATFEFWIKTPTVEGSKVSVAKASSGISMNRATDLDISSDIAKKHTELNSNAKASPGYCASGKLFTSGC